MLRLYRTLRLYGMLRLFRTFRLYGMLRLCRTFCLYGMLRLYTRSKTPPSHTRRSVF